MGVHKCSRKFCECCVLVVIVAVVDLLGVDVLLCLNMGGFVLVECCFRLLVHVSFASVF